MKALGLGGGGALPSALYDDADVAKVLESRASAELIAQRDSVGLEHLTGVATEPRHLKILKGSSHRSRSEAAPRPSSNNTASTR